MLQPPRWVMRFLGGIVTCLWILLVSVSVARAQNAADPPLLVIQDVVCGTDTTSPCELKRTLQIQLAGTTKDWTKTGRGVEDLLLVIQGVPFDGIRARQTSQDGKILLFFLDPEINKPEWKALLAGRERQEKFAFAMGIKDTGTVASATTLLKIVSTAQEQSFSVRPEYTTLVYVFLGLLIIAIVVLGVKSDLLRDSGLDPSATERRPYSLARTQLALWTVVIIGSYLFIWVILGNTNPLNTTALTLLGLSALTGLASNVIDTQTPGPTAKSAATGVAAAATAQKSENFLIDILSDQNGVSIYRFQMAVWTLVLAFVFVYEVWWDLGMPTFDPVILGLMGISNGTYVGVKIPNVTGGSTS
jgi:hypothetical protein